jgi:hypothetical protein
MSLNSKIQLPSHHGVNLQQIHLTFSQSGILVLLILKNMSYYISQNRLIKEYGWNLNLVGKYLKTEDKRLKNPKNGSYPPMKLFDMDNVQRIMNTRAFREDLASLRAEQRKRKAKKLKKMLLKAGKLLG